mmetsp:Transcript_98969/g.236157  ORF Transcript_98969/g.236157 Transcript_98969/m.236157 type:complete len:287 (+) Transcript_98969:1820-2680(+)
MLGVGLDGEAFPCVVQHRGFADTWELGLGGLLYQGGAVFQHLPDHHCSHLREDLDELREHLAHPGQEVQGRNLLDQPEAQALHDLHGGARGRTADQVGAQVEHGADGLQAEADHGLQGLGPVQGHRAKVEVEEVTSLAHQSDPAFLTTPIDKEAVFINLHVWCAGVRTTGTPVREATDQDVNCHLHRVNDSVGHEGHLVACMLIGVAQRVSDEARAVICSRRNVGGGVGDGISGIAHRLCHCLEESATASRPATSTGRSFRLLGFLHIIISLSLEQDGVLGLLVTF